MIMNLALEISHKLRYKLFEAPKGYGLPVATEVLERQYREGFWKFLDSVDELPNYMVTVGYVQHFARRLDRPARLLDIGCGHGNLAELLSGYRFESYLGLDVSADAVRRAANREIKNAAFKVADVNDWMPDEKFDFILLTGAICYFKDPVGFLQRYARALTADGMFIISLWRYGHNSAIWKNIEEHFETVEATVVTNSKGMSWDIKVVR